MTIWYQGLPTEYITGQPVTALAPLLIAQTGDQVVVPEHSEFEARVLQQFLLGHGLSTDVHIGTSRVGASKNLHLYMPGVLAHVWGLCSESQLVATERLFDRLKFHQMALEHGWPVPRGWVVHAQQPHLPFISLYDTQPWPRILKPVRSMGGRHIETCLNLGDLIKALQLPDRGRMWLQQQVLGEQYTLHVCGNERWVTAGASGLAIPVSPQTATTIAACWGPIEWAKEQGLSVLNVEVVVNNGDAYIIDVNPRYSHPAYAKLIASRFTSSLGWEYQKLAVPCGFVPTDLKHLVRSNGQKLQLLVFGYGMTATGGHIEVLLFGRTVHRAQLMKQVLKVVQGQ